MNEVITFMGKQIERNKLFSQTFIIALLEDEGANFTTLANVRNWYIKQFGNELSLSYPFSQGMDNGILILPVQEGFLRLPFDEVDEFTFEQFDLHSAGLLTAAEVEVMEKELNTYVENLLGVLADMRTVLSSGEREVPSCSGVLL